MILTADKNGERVDAALARLAEDLSRSAAQRLLADGLVLKNGILAKKNDKTAVGDTLEFTLPDCVPTELAAQDIPLDIVYEDDDVIVINKPKGLVVHPAPGHADGTVVNALMHHCADSLSGIGGELRPGIVHRIDKDTSGLLIAAKNDFAHQKLAAQLKDHTLARTYAAISVKILAPLTHPSAEIRKTAKKCALPIKTAAMPSRTGKSSSATAAIRTCAANSKQAARIKSVCIFPGAAIPSSVTVSTGIKSRNSVSIRSVFTRENSSSATRARMRPCTSNALCPNISHRLWEN